MKNISAINPAIMENTEYSIVIVHSLFINIKVGVSLDHGISLCFILLLALRAGWEAFQAKNNVRSAPASSALTLVSHQSHNARTANCHVRGSGVRNRAQMRTKVCFGRTMMQALELLQLANGMSPQTK